MSNPDPSNPGAIALARLQNLLQHPGFRIDEHMKCYVDGEFLVRNENQPRTTFDPEKLERHKESIKNGGQIEPVVIIPWLTESNGKYIGKIVDGERTWRACKELHRAVYVVFTDPPKDEDELFERALIANFDQEKHTINETVRAITRLHDEHGRTFEEIRKRLGLGSQMDVSNFYKLRLLHPELQPLLDISPVESREKKTPRLAKILGLKLAEFPKDRQKALWFEVMGKGALEAIRAIDDMQAVGKIEQTVVRRGPRQVSPAQAIEQIGALVQRALNDINLLCSHLPSDKLPDLVQKMRASGGLKGTLQQIETLYMTAAYLYMGLAGMNAEQTRSATEAKQIRDLLRQQLNLRDWEPEVIRRAREAQRKQPNPQAPKKTTDRNAGEY
ncbi:MAG: hypothetical protein RL150_718 [Candidatus Parcubacteria bacterium]|jgi:ParB/RepB/Spo0J family partition protein